MEIDYKQPVDYKNVYSQTMHLLKSGFRYWMENFDIEEINHNNEAFRVRTPEEEFFYTYFRKPAKKDTAVQWITTSQILKLMCFKTHLPFTHGGTIRLGIILKKGGFTCNKPKNKALFCVVRINDDEVNNAKEGKDKSPDNDEEDVDLEPILPF